MTAPVLVRPPAEGDRDAFLAMWDDFVATDPAEPGDRGMGPVNWARLRDPAHPLAGLIATDPAGAPQGFLLHVVLPFTWSRGEVSYLLDLYTRPESRGRGVARALIAELAAIGRAAGWYKIFWMTQTHNATSQRLYDRVAVRGAYVRYDLPLSGG